MERPNLPAILAPAGNRDAFLSAIAAGADAIYCGLKRFSARMAAENFDLSTLTALTRLAHHRRIRVYIALNTLIRPMEIDLLGELINVLQQQVGPDGLICQDLSVVEIARQVGFSGELHLSTLANVSHPDALRMVRERFGVDRVVIPRELSIDEIRAMAAQCPADLGLELFVHGAICYGISGRCYWSSYLGGRSGLRGRCVQPCRRIYRHQGQQQRLFSPQDLSLDVLVKVLREIPEIVAWKIEGRKKGAHYVYQTVTGYRLLRDRVGDPARKKRGLAHLEYALGRPTTHYRFLPQRPQNPIDPSRQTGSGMLIGHTKGSRRKPYLVPRIQLFSGDRLRIGYEDAPGHSTLKVPKYIPKKGRLYLTQASRQITERGLPVFLIDRRERELETALAELESELALADEPTASHRKAALRLPRPRHHREPVVDIHIGPTPEPLPRDAVRGEWIHLSQAGAGAFENASDSIWCWLPPVIWPGENGNIERRWRERIRGLVEGGARRFVVNAPWQIGLIESRGKSDLRIWAGPFCNLTNPLALQMLKSAGVAGAVVSPELGGEDLITLARQSPLPLGIVLTGLFPLSVSRIMPPDLMLETPVVSPKNEVAWATRVDSETWIYPNWPLDLTACRQRLIDAGYRQLIHLHTPLPGGVALKDRPGLWNWEIDLK